MSEVEADVDAYLDLVAAIEAAMHPVYVLEVVQGLRSGDILHIQIGGQIDEGMPAYVPDDDARDKAREEWEKVVPEGVKVVVTTIWEHVSIIPVGS